MIIMKKIAHFRDVVIPDLWYKIKYVFFLLCRFLKLQNKVVFQSYHGLYSGNPMFIYEKMRELDTEGKIKFVWVIKDPGFSVPGAKTVRPKSLSFFYHMATAKVWIDNSRKEWLRKRDGQYYVQTWHGDLRLKKIENDAADKLSPGYVRMAKNDSEMIDLFITGSDWFYKMLPETFWYNGQILKVGIPKSDILFANEEKKREIYSKISSFYNFDKEYDILIYAPTFRDSSDLSVYNLDYESVVRAYRDKFGKECKLLVRLHPNIMRLRGGISYNENVLNGSLYPDINELIVAGHMLITDYSSCMFDAMLAGKKVFIYAPDIEEYTDERGFYWKFDELPFSVAQNNDELIRGISLFDETAYTDKVTKFKALVGAVENPHASETVAGYILENYCNF